MLDNGPDKIFNLRGKIAAITGGGGVLCSAMAKALAARGVKVAVLDLKKEAAEKLANEIKENGGESIGLNCNVLERDSLEQAQKAVLEKFGKVDILINGAGGNNPKATTSKERLEPDDLTLLGVREKDKPSAVKTVKTFFELDSESIQFVFNLNFLGTLLAAQVFAADMANRGEGIILNVSSMNAMRPLTKIPAYSAAKAAVSNFTQWLAIHLAPVNIRVNAIAPGFFLTDQNRFLLINEKTGELTPRGKTIINHTPMEKFGEPGDLIGTLLWLVSPASSFVTGIVVPVDGGFSAFSGV